LVCVVSLVKMEMLTEKFSQNY